MSQQPTGEKTEQPTHKKLRDARKKGQVARSQDLVTTISLLGVIAYLWLAWDYNFAKFVEMLDIVAALHGAGFRASAFNALQAMFDISIVVVLPLLGVGFALGIAGNYFQFGSIFAFENLKPKIENISPAKGLKKIFSVKQLVEFLKSLIKIIFLSVLLFFVIRDAIGPYMNAVQCGLQCLTAVTSSMLLTTLLFTALAFAIVSGFDFIFQKFQHKKELMMTKTEVQREYKETEGDPLIKGRRKQLAQEMVLSDGIDRTRNATAVIVNPTHFAVVIDYKPDIAPLPLIVAKGRNLHAHDLRTEAEKHGVPVFRNVLLARSLYAESDVGAFVPDEWFEVIAKILVWVDKNRESLYTEPLKHGVIDMEGGNFLR
ncbi:translocation protein in type III secretion [Stappia aggregata IAM 12614]|uniref:Translocation protein in type III secretion n=1 Tax=Roseibium aggregatum (strain ATCC 25650 / DSM 13394 / JCM 20685 / NBRC 16684 / NCIMB 2208 / IAM 12614 / B1) TaxID=384765 RepID=A0P0L7_ROSAI|nr:type III secretion system export apparatus subunit SctU [Roseibium aggregatum]EAV41331.1 translocation protein in type III secretion [Stappia aggregata IAM 12614] [Roseibium aggregatum IAM 12614]